MEQFAISSVSQNLEAVDAIYWDSLEAVILFARNTAEGVVECLIRRISVLSDAIFNDDGLLELLDDIESIKDLRTKQKKYSNALFVSKESMRERTSVHESIHMEKLFLQAIVELNKLSPNG